MWVIRKLNQSEIKEYDLVNTTKHFLEDRKDRFDVYQLGKYIIGAFEVDKGHRDGNEVHMIDNLGYIYIFNYKSKRFITILSGRPAQIKRYWRDLNIRYGVDVERAARSSLNRNKRTNANHI